MYTITASDGSFEMRVVRKSAGRYRVDVNTKPILAERFFRFLRETYIVKDLRESARDQITFILELELLAYVFERDHLYESLSNLYESALAIHANEFFFNPRATW